MKSSIKVGKATYSSYPSVNLVQALSENVTKVKRPTMMGRIAKSLILAVILLLVKCLTKLVLLLLAWVIFLLGRFSRLVTKKGQLLLGAMIEAVLKVKVELRIYQRKFFRNYRRWKQESLK